MEEINKIVDKVWEESLSKANKKIRNAKTRRRTCEGGGDRQYYLLKGGAKVRVGDAVVDDLVTGGPIKYGGVETTGKEDIILN